MAGKIIRRQYKTFPFYVQYDPFYKKWYSWMSHYWGTNVIGEGKTKEQSINRAKEYIDNL